MIDYFQYSLRDQIDSSWLPECLIGPVTFQRKFSGKVLLRTMGRYSRVLPPTGNGNAQSSNTVAIVANMANHRYAPLESVLILPKTVYATQTLYSCNNYSLFVLGISQLFLLDNTGKLK